MTLWLVAPEKTPGPSSEPTLVNSVASSNYSESEAASEAEAETLTDVPASTLRKRRTRKKSYCCNPCHEEGLCSSEEESDCPPTPVDDYFPDLSLPDKDTIDQAFAEYLEDTMAPRILPQYRGQDSACDDGSVMGSFLDSFSPYHEMSHPQCDFGKVLGRLLTEWYAVGASLLAAAG